MPRPRALSIAIAAFATLLAGCGLLLGFEDHELYPAGVADAGSDVDAPPTDGEADTMETKDGGTTVSLAPNPGFEVDGIGCGTGWSADSTALSNAFIEREDAAARTGKHSCRVCRGSGDSSNFIAYAELVDPPPGIYRLQGYERAAPGKSAPENASLDFAVTLSNGYNTAPTAYPKVTDGGWTGAQTSLDVEPGASRLRVRIGGNGGDAGDCVLWDDIVLTRE